jgi:hypothetical protein
MSNGLEQLPERTLVQMLGGLLLTYFRSAHPSPRKVHLLREYPLEETAPHPPRADFVIYDEEARLPLAAFELVRSASALKGKRDALAHWAATMMPQVGRKFILGIVAPASLASSLHLRKWAEEQGFELITYPD